MDKDNRVKLFVVGEPRLEPLIPGCATDSQCGEASV